MNERVEACCSLIDEIAGVSDTIAAATVAGDFAGLVDATRRADALAGQLEAEIRGIDTTSLTDEERSWLVAHREHLRRRADRAGSVLAAAHELDAALVTAFARLSAERVGPVRLSGGGMDL